MKYESVVKAQDLLEQLTKSRSPKTQYQAAEVMELLEPLFKREEENKLQKERETKRSWGDIEPLTLARTARRILYKAPYYLSEAKEELRLIEAEERDILHAFELITDLTVEKKLELTERITDLLRERRVIKRFVELMEPLGDYTYKNKPYVVGLKFIIDEMVKISESLEKRSYTPRRAKDLEEAFKQVSPTKEAE